MQKIPTNGSYDLLMMEYPLAAQALADLRKYCINYIFQDSPPNRAGLFKAGLR